MASSLVDLVNIMKPNSGDGEAPVASTAVNQRPKHTPQYGQWKYGKPGDSSNRKFVNAGL